MRTLVWGLLILACLGLARMHAFRVVDGSRASPWAAFRPNGWKARCGPSTMPFVLINSYSPVEKHDTDAAGSVNFESSGSKFMVNPLSKNQDYNQAMVTPTWSGAKIYYPAERREVDVQAHDGVVDVPLLQRLHSEAGPVQPPVLKPGPAVRAPCDGCCPISASAHE